MYVAAAEAPGIAEEQKEERLDRAVELLGDSRAEGFGHHGPKNMFWDEDPGFEILRGRDDYQLLIEADKENIKKRKNK